jgi:hypothetical protein
LKVAGMTHGTGSRYRIAVAKKLHERDTGSQESRFWSQTTSVQADSAMRFHFDDICHILHVTIGQLVFGEAAGGMASI